MFPDIDEVLQMLDEIAKEVPEKFFKGLNLGIALMEETKHNKNYEQFLVLGEYEITNIGRGIKVYYGSVKATYYNCTKEQLYEYLKDIVYHEFTHHLESLAGERGLEIKDEQWIREHLKR